MEVRQLPRGRHRLTREEVTASQRGRMLEAMAEAVAEKGYTHMAVADVVSGAGVSRETFYQHFADKEDCFLAAFDLVVDAVRQTMVEAVSGRPAEIFAARTVSDRFACEALVAATSAMVTVRVAAGEIEQLPGLRTQLVELARRLKLTPAARGTRRVGA